MVNKIKFVTCLALLLAAWRCDPVASPAKGDGKPEGSGVETAAATATETATATATETATATGTAITTTGNVDVTADTDGGTDGPVVGDDGGGELAVTYTAEEKNSILATGTVLIAVTTGARGPARAETESYYKISAPLFPNTLYLYNNEDPSYPATPADQLTVATTGHYTYATMKDSCKTHAEYQSDIKDETDTVKLTKAERAAMYDAIANCANVYFANKPYTLPQLLDDVDVCKVHMGDGWRLIKEADVMAYPDAVFTTLYDVLASANAMIPAASHHFSLGVYVRGTDGSLKVASLYPGATTRVVDAPWANAMHHFEGTNIDGGTTGVSYAAVVIRCTDAP